MRAQGAHGKTAARGTGAIRWRAIGVRGAGGQTVRAQSAHGKTASHMPKAKPMKCQWQQSTGRARFASGRATYGFTPCQWPSHLRFHALLVAEPLAPQPCHEWPSNCFAIGLARSSLAVRAPCAHHWKIGASRMAGRSAARAFAERFPCAEHLRAFGARTGRARQDGFARDEGDPAAGEARGGGPGGRAGARPSQRGGGRRKGTEQS